MKKLISTVFMGLIFTTSVMADTYSTLSFKAKLSYRSSDGEVLSMGSSTGTFFNKQMQIGDELFALVSGSPYSQRLESSCAEFDAERSPYIKATIPKNAMRAMMLQAIPSMFRSNETESEVAKIVESITKDLENVTISGGFCAHNYVSDNDSRNKILRFDDKKTGASLKIEIRLARSLGSKTIKEASDRNNW
ncbi:MAG TPA: hypothetical protein VNJ08_11990 [Bacteriovoracaceae bacterium]|nr:hypothetical protein [Bacteriovoracaceae bacterium]